MATLPLHASALPDHHVNSLSFLLEPECQPAGMNHDHQGSMKTSKVMQGDDAANEAGAHVPTHPIPSMQGAFAESMMDASEPNDPASQKNVIKNASSRRKALLDQDATEKTHASRWGQKPGQQYHESWKLMAQISFGIYLLLNGIAKDDQQVMNILQGHVDEVDEFLETTLEDFDLAQEDIDERLKFLKLPLENISIFDAMLEDRRFRLQIVTGNERIEHVITRTATAMNDALKDVQQGMDACREFSEYLAEEQEDPIWKGERPDMHKVFDAMKGNVEGWHKAYVSLQTKGNHLGIALVQLGSIVAEMDRRAGEISRRTRFSISPTKSQSDSPSSKSSPPASPPRKSQQLRQSMLKNLPSDPSQITPAIRVTLPAFQLVQDRERTPDSESRRTSESSEIENPESFGENNFILKPRTYTPVSSPRPPAAVLEALQTSPPETGKRVSLRKRFSLKRKENPTEITTNLKPAPAPIADGHRGARQRVQSISPYTTHERTLNTPPSRGLDSAYCSDFERKSPAGGMHHSLKQTLSQQSSISARTFPAPPRNFENGPTIPSPLSDQQFFRPVNASPNSPLQRPWTAAPTNIQMMHSHSNSSISNLSTLRGHMHTPSGLGDRRAAQSAMGMSVMSEMTMVTEVGANGKTKKVKKKRSALGWLKKQFSLSEEEKAEFEEKRRNQYHGSRDGYRNDYYERPPSRWVDGKRIR